MLLGVPARLHGLSNRADLIRLEDEALDSALLMRPLEQRGICDRQIVADEQRTGELLCRDLVALPVVLVENVLDEEERILLGQLLDIGDLAVAVNRRTVVVSSYISEAAQSSA